MKAFVLIVVLLAGCARTTVNGGSAHIEGGRGLATLFAISIISAGIVETERGRYIEETRDAPPMAEDRRVSEQDCTQPIDHTLGNIRCK